MEAQRFPEDFDGIMAGDAITNELIWQASWDGQHITNPYSLAGFIPSAILPTVTSAAQTNCANSKTVSTDTFLGDPTQCSFDLAIAGVRPDPFTDGLAEQAVYQGPVTSAGVSLGPGFEPGNEAQLCLGTITEAMLTLIPSDSAYSFTTGIAAQMQLPPGSVRSPGRFRRAHHPGNLRFLPNR